MNSQEGVYRTSALTPKSCRPFSENSVNKYLWNAYWVPGTLLVHLHRSLGVRVMVPTLWALEMLSEVPWGHPQSSKRTRISSSRWKTWPSYAPSEWTGLLALLWRPSWTYEPHCSSLPCIYFLTYKMGGRNMYATLRPANVQMPWISRKVPCLSSVLWYKRSSSRKWVWYRRRPCCIMALVPLIWNRPELNPGSQGIPAWLSG